MKYCLGYNETEKNDIFRLKDDNFLNKLKSTLGTDTQIINLAVFPDKDDIDSFKDTLKKVSLEDSMNFSYELVNQGIRDALLRGKVFSYDEYQGILVLITQCTLFFKDFQNRENFYTPRTDIQIEEPKVEKTKWPKGFFGRYGNVELRVIESWLLNRDTIREVERKVCASINDEEYIRKGPTRKHWLSALDVEFNIRTLMTNAGFYCADEDDGSFETWCQSYYNALKNATALMPYPASYVNFFFIQDKLFSEGKYVKYISPPPHKFYEMLEDEDILFVTPFSDLINDQYESGRIFNLYKDLKIPNFKMKALPAYLSTYPNRPHSSWLETFNIIKQQIDDAFSQNEFTLFFASAGCYGMPLCDYVYSKYGCTSVYYGNHINTLFGISQACSVNFKKDQKNLENWADSTLGKVEGLDKIDGGRYI